MSTTESDTQDQLNMDDLEALLDEASQSLCAATGEDVPEPAELLRPFALGELSPSDVDQVENPMEMLDEVELDLRVELGRTLMRLEEVLRLRRGSVVMLSKLAGDPVDIFANERLIARGEVLVMNDQFCVRVTELLGAVE
ncbi:flagellar motor switch protein FliN [Allorhodopirellula heiligendammensis]|uniref:Flagellar motor switch protein FliN n=1 Tax=Allorhodopirellula heiligendammensis TaxID=2714739 RepID=A0A5C6BTB2_9BACT|nr:flagellar motor switch protein FliN [Allorhodopirellula heiligendammensis]TWU15245.1 Flagellar motor switch protein FliN [Allorhodopirellula heiligendammensis]